MSAVGGSVESISINNRLFPVAADSDLSQMLGGSSNDVQANGDGTARLIKKVTPWKVGGIDVAIDHDREDLEFLQDTADGLDFVPITVTMADGNTYQGRGQITGDIEASTEKATAGITLQGPQKLELQ